MNGKDFTISIDKTVYFIAHHSGVWGYYGFVKKIKTTPSAYFVRFGEHKRVICMTVNQTEI